jgi:hypothetical protein
MNYGDVTIANEGLQSLGLCLALRAFEQGGIFIAPQLLSNGTSVSPVSSEGPTQSVAFYDTRGDVEDLFQPGSSRDRCAINKDIHDIGHDKRFCSQQRISQLT